MGGKFFLGLAKRIQRTTDITGADIAKQLNKSEIVKMIQEFHNKARKLQQAKDVKMFTKCTRFKRNRCNLLLVLYLLSWITSRSVR